VPGRIEAVRATGLTPAALERALPLAPGDVVSLEAIEQGVQQINRLRMYQARMRVLPGTSAGTSLLDILLAEGRSWSLAVGLDNQGQRSTGRGRTPGDGALRQCPRLARRHPAGLAAQRTQRRGARFHHRSGRIQPLVGNRVGFACRPRCCGTRPA
jgi:hypothetical protein